MPNLLALVDLVSTNRTKVYRTSYFPFLQALARAHGWHVRWLCVGVDAEVQASRENPFIFHLPAGDRELLGERLAELKPDRVLFNERLDGDTWEHLAAAAAGAAMGRVTADVPGWLGGNERRRPGQERPRLTEQELEPDHRRELVNPLAARIKPYVWLMLGPFCLYRRPLKQNLSFLGVDLSGCSRDDTCSFCTPPVDERPPADVVGAALAQILAAERSTPEVCRSREYVVDGGALWFKIGPFLDAVLARDLPPSAFFFHCRADDLLAKAAEVEARLPLLENAGHSLNIFSIGVENFSRAENQRFNKKIDPEMVQMAAELMYRWEERFPRSFCFSSHGGFSFILYTPWTNLEDLEANIQGLKRLRPYCTEVEFALRTRLQLLERRPITALAQRDGLVNDSFDDQHLFDSGCITDWDVTELPWRFAHRQVALLYKLSRRLSRDPSIPRDEASYAAVQRLLKDQPGSIQRDSLGLMERALKLVREDPEISSLEQLLESLRPETPGGDDPAPNKPSSLDMGAMGIQICVRGPCNLACLFCNLFREQSVLDEDAHFSELVQEIDRLAAQGIRTLSWGVYHHEPTTFSRLPELVQHARHQGIATNRLITNGIRTADPEYCQILRDAGVDALVVTLVEADAQAADTLCQGKGVVEARRRTFENCRIMGIRVFPVFLLMRANYHNIGEALDLYGDLLDNPTLQLVQPTMEDRVASFLPPLSGVMVEVAAAARRLAPRRMTVVNIPRCIQERFAADLPNLSFRVEAKGEYPDQCVGCHMRQDCCGFSGPYLSIYGGAEVTEAEARHNPISMDRLSRRLARHIEQRQRGGDEIAYGASSRKLLAILSEILLGGESSRILGELEILEVAMAHHERASVTLEYAGATTRLLVAWRQKDIHSLLNAGPFSLMLPREDPGASRAGERAAKCLARELLKGWKRGPS